MFVSSVKNSDDFFLVIDHK